MWRYKGLQSYCWAGLPCNVLRHGLLQLELDIKRWLIWGSWRIAQSDIHIIYTRPLCYNFCILGVKNPVTQHPSRSFAASPGLPPLSLSILLAQGSDKISVSLCVLQTSGLIGCIIVPCELFSKSLRSVNGQLRLEIHSKRVLASASMLLPHFALRECWEVRNSKMLVRHLNLVTSQQAKAGLAIFLEPILGLRDSLSRQSDGSRRDSEQPSGWRDTAHACRLWAPVQGRFDSLQLKHSLSSNATCKRVLASQLLVWHTRCNLTAWRG